MDFLLVTKAKSKALGMVTSRKASALKGLVPPRAHFLKWVVILGMRPVLFFLLGRENR